MGAGSIGVGVIGSVVAAVGIGAGVARSGGDVVVPVLPLAVVGSAMSGTAVTATLLLVGTARTTPAASAMVIKMATRMCDFFIPLLTRNSRVRCCSYADSPHVTSATLVASLR